MAAALGIVLLVEDDRDIHHIVASVLTDEGYEIDSSYDGLAGIQMLLQYQPPPDHFCLVLLDMMMPKIDGLGVLQHLTQCSHFVPVVAMSASGSRWPKRGMLEPQQRSASLLSWPIC